MNETTMLAAEVSAETLSALRAMAAERGTTPERLAGDLVRDGMQVEADLRDAIAEGRRAIAAGQGIGHEELVAELRDWRRRHAPPA